MNFSAVKAKIKEIVDDELSSVGGVDYEVDSCWENTTDDGAFEFASNGDVIHVVLSFPTITTVGRAELVTEWETGAAVNEEFSQTVSEQKRMTLRIRIERDDQTYGNSSQPLAQHLASCFSKRSVSDDLETVDIGFAGILSENTFDESMRQRMVSVSILDVLLNGYYEISDDPTGYIEILEVETNFIGPDGNPTTQQFTGDIDIT